MSPWFMCRICHTPKGWRDTLVYGICRTCWIGCTAERVIGMIPVEEGGDGDRA